MVTYLLVSYTLTVVEESPKATAVEMIQDCEQKMLIELKGCRKLRGENLVTFPRHKRVYAPAPKFSVNP